MLFRSTGNPVPIIRRGNIDQNSMRELRFSIEDLMSQLRINGFFDIQEVAWAIVETNGQLTVYPKAKSQPLTQKILSDPEGQIDTPPMVLISDGVVSPKVLKECNLTEKWLSGVLEKENLSEKEVFLMTCDPSAKYYIVKKEAKK